MLFIIFYFFFQLCPLTVENILKNVKTSNISFETFTTLQKMIYAVGNNTTTQIKMETIVANNQIVNTNFH